MRNLSIFLLLILSGFLLFTGCATVTKHQDGTASIKQMNMAKATTVRTKLAQDKILAGVVIKVTVANHVCTLEGNVPNEEAKKKAEELTAKVEGIDKIINNLKVSDNQ